MPAPGLRRRIGGARGLGWEAGLPRGRGGGGTAPSQQPASSERASRRWVRRAAAAGGGGHGAEAEVGRRARRGGLGRPGGPGWEGCGRAPEGRRGGGGGTRVPTPSFSRAASGPASPPRAPGPRAGHSLGRRGGRPGGRQSVFSSASNLPFPSPLSAPHPVRKRKEQKVPDPRLRRGGTRSLGPGKAARPAGPWGQGCVRAELGSLRLRVASPRLASPRGLVPRCGQVLAAGLPAFGVRERGAGPATGKGSALGSARRPARGPRGPFPSVASSSW